MRERATETERERESERARQRHRERERQRDEPEGRGSYSRLGMRSAMPVMLAMMLLWEIITPLGMPVEPLVYMMTAMSDGAGCLRAAATEQEKKRRRRRRGVNESQKQQQEAGLVDK